jgi:hypothetical protein
MPRNNARPTSTLFSGDLPRAGRTAELSSTRGSSPAVNRGHLKKIQAAEPARRARAACAQLGRGQLRIFHMSVGPRIRREMLRTIMFVGSDGTNRTRVRRAFINSIHERGSFFSRCARNSSNQKVPGSCIRRFDYSHVFGADALLHASAAVNRNGICDRCGGCRRAAFTRGVHHGAKQLPSYKRTRRHMHQHKGRSAWRD